MTAPPRSPSLFRDRHFRFVFAADSVSKLGVQVSYLVLPVLALTTLDASAAEVGVLGALGPAAFLLIGLPAGAWLDRIRRRRVMIAADVVRAVLFASIPLAWAADALTLAQLYLVALATGIATVFFDIAAMSYLPHLVGRDRLLAANSTLHSVNAVAEISGRGLGGLLLQLATAPLAIAVNSLTLLWSAVFIGLIRRPEPRPEPVRRRHLGREMREGLSHVFGHGHLRVIAIESAWANVCLRVIVTMIPILFIVELGLPEAWLGGFLAVGGIGVFAGSLAARGLGARLGHGRALWIVGATCTPFVLLVPFIDRGAMLWLGLGGWLVATFKVGVDGVLKTSIRQRTTPDRLQGRMNGTFRTLITGALAVGSLAAGLLAEASTVRAALWVGSAGLALGWLLLFASPLRTMRELPTLVKAA
ncbi:MFS transporter [Stackebrandtia nassauensis]|uniref:Major facilitator superfamily MFS_1 n=1 Tax=Stackebrandtia nassauensis (strain DSM 44728 / CIP 108903 / NRRL B-16338 / NBRC 102104 / LLR-40K-21) TaxID=446470 RepID=D3PXG3_STANL|nr:MFS transporter [Stackebrandtia nassauensis]ADD41426.1 major facilitator superfamily MFS_1 [Stackebrandtia nassauensis DSM 44728]